MKTIELGNIDGRTKAGRIISDIKKAVKSDLDSAAVAIFEEDLANLQVLQRLIIKSVLKNNTLDEKALNIYLRYQAASKAIILALKKFSDEKPPAKGLGDLILEQSEED